MTPNFNAGIIFVRALDDKERFRFFAPEVSVKSSITKQGFITLIITGHIIHHTGLLGRQEVLVGLMLKLTPRNIC